MRVSGCRGEGEPQGAIYRLRACTRWRVGGGTLKESETNTSESQRRKVIRDKILTETGAGEIEIEFGTISRDLLVGDLVLSDGA